MASDSGTGDVVISGLTKRYGGTLALRDVSLTISPGEVVALVGHNGAGKSTLSKALAGFVRPDAGSITVGEHELHQWSQKEAFAAGVSLVPQQFTIVPELTIEENMTLGKPASQARIAEVAESLGIASMLRTPADRLSLAVHRLAMIGRALLRDSRVIILDEPTAAFSSPEVDKLFQIIRELKRSKIAIVYVSHRLQEIIDIADRVIGMSGGAIVCDLPAATLSRDELADIIAGSHQSGGEHHQSGTQADTRAERGEAVLVIDELRTTSKIDSATFRLHRGEVLGITGLIGAGRTSLLNTIWGIYGKPDFGRLEVDGVAYVPRFPAEAKKRGIAYIPEGRARTSVIPALSVAQNVTFASLLVRRAPLRNPFISTRREQATVTDVLAALSTKPVGAARMDMNELSGGNQQKAVIARWLLTESEIFMLDEPTEGVDVAAKQEIHRMLRGLANRGKAVIISSSDIEEVVEYADRVLVMKAGSIVEEISGDHLTIEYVSRACLQ